MPAEEQLRAAVEKSDVDGGNGGGGEQEEDDGATDAARGAQPAGDGDEVVRALEEALEEELASTNEPAEDPVRRQFPSPEEAVAGLGVSVQVEDAAAPDPRARR